MVSIRILSRGHHDIIWCFCYQYTTWIISLVINMLLGKSPTVAWYKHKNICYIIPFTDLVIWVCNIYILDSKQQKNILDPRTSTYPFVCPPVI